MKKYIDKHLIFATKGFTLIEVVVSVFLFSLIVYGVIGLVSNILTVSRQQGGLLSDQDQSRQVVFQMMKELRDAQVGANGGYYLDTAASQQIIFYSNADTDAAIERIRYYVQNGQLWKGVTNPNGTVYNTSTEQTVLIQKDLANGGNPLFYYYDDTYVGSSTQTSLAQPVNVTSVKFIQANLQVYNKAGVRNTGIYTITGSGAVRNAKTNLGQ